MRRVLLVALAALPAVAVSASSASAASCTTPVMSAGNGLGIVQVRSSGVGCRTARAVASRAAGRSDGKIRSRLTVDRRRWRCRVTRAATGTDPGYIARTKVRCTSGRAVVRFQLAS